VKKGDGKGEIFWRVAEKDVMAMRVIEERRCSMLRPSGPWRLYKIYQFDSLLHEETRLNLPLPGSRHIIGCFAPTLKFSPRWFSRRSRTFTFFVATKNSLNGSYLSRYATTSDESFGTALGVLTLGRDFMITSS